MGLSVFPEFTLSASGLLLMEFNGFDIMCSDAIVIMHSDEDWTCLLYALYCYM